MPSERFTWESSDFSSIDSIDLISLSDINRNDDNGFTPLCFAALNNVQENLFAYFIYKFRPSLTLVCDNGSRTPLQLACSALNDSAIKVLFGIYPEDGYTLTYSNGKSVRFKPLLHLAIPDRFYSRYKNEVFEASKLPKSNCIVALIDVTNGQKMSLDGSYTDEYGLTPLIWASKMKCYESVDKLLSIEDISSDGHMSISYSSDNELSESAISVATSNKDTGLFKIFSKYLDEDLTRGSTSLDINGSFYSALRLSRSLASDYFEGVIVIASLLSTHRFTHDESFRLEYFRAKLFDNITFSYIIKNSYLEPTTPVLKLIFSDAIEKSINDKLSDCIVTLVKKREFTTSNDEWDSVFSASIENKWHAAFYALVSNISYNAENETFYKEDGTNDAIHVAINNNWDDVINVLVEKPDLESSTISNKFSDILRLIITNSLDNKHPKAFEILINKDSFTRFSYSFSEALDSSISEAQYKPYFTILFNKASFELNDVRDDSLEKALKASIKYDNKSFFDQLFTKIDSNYSRLGDIISFVAINYYDEYFLLKLTSIVSASTSAFNAALSASYNYNNEPLFKLLVSRTDFTMSSEVFYIALRFAFSKEWDDSTAVLISKFDSTIYSHLHDKYSESDTTVLDFIESHINNYNSLKRVICENYSNDYLNVLLYNKCYNIINVLIFYNKLSSDDIHGEGYIDVSPVVVIKDVYGHQGSYVVLDASGSYSFYDDALNYQWLDRNNLVLCHDPKLDFKIPEDAITDSRYEFTVVISDNHGGVSSKQARVIVTNNSPIAKVAQSVITSSPGDIVELDASESIDPDGDPLTYKWISIPENILTEADSIKKSPSFSIPSDLLNSTTYLFTVAVSDNHGGYDSKEVTVVVTSAHQNQPPIVVVNNVDGHPGDTVTLDASYSEDVDGEIISYVWSGDYADGLVGKTTSKPAFKIPNDAIAGTTYTFTVTVTDNNGSYNSKSATVTVLEPIKLGTLAFISGTFSVDTDPDSMPNEHGITSDVKTVWQSVYDDGYNVPQVPKSSNENPFSYNLIYDESL